MGGFGNRVVCERLHQAHWTQNWPMEVGREANLEFYRQIFDEQWNLK